MTVAPRFVRMLLSTSSAHCEGLAFLASSARRRAPIQVGYVGANPRRSRLARRDRIALESGSSTVSSIFSNLSAGPRIASRNAMFAGARSLR
jgi:hypothetical protein